MQDHLSWNYVEHRICNIWINSILLYNTSYEYFSESSQGRERQEKGKDYTYMYIVVFFLLLPAMFNKCITTTYLLPCK